MPGKRTVVKRTVEETAAVERGQRHTMLRAADRIEKGRDLYEVAAEMGWPPRILALRVAPELIRRGLVSAARVAGALRQGRQEEYFRRMRTG